MGASFSSLLPRDILPQHFASDSYRLDRTICLRAALDGRGRHQGHIAAIFYPHNEKDLQELFRLGDKYDWEFIVQGGNTSNVQGATPHPSRTPNRCARIVLISMKKMRSILSVDPINNTIRAQAGVTLAEIQEAAKKVGRMVPLSFGAQGSAQVGGIAATNAGGVHVLRFGNARRQILGLRVVLPTGEILALDQGLRKNNAGYDLQNLFIGSEGTLGVITEVVWAMRPAIVLEDAFWIRLQSLEGVERLFMHLEAALGPQLIAFELMGRSPLESYQKVFARPLPLPIGDWQVLVSVAHYHAWCSDDERLAHFRRIFAPLFDTVIDDIALALQEEQREAFWRIRERIPLAVKRLGGNVKHDISVPRNQIVSMIQSTRNKLIQFSSDFAPSIFGHYGDGNLHFNVGTRQRDPRSIFAWEERIHKIVHDEVCARGGSIAAEHGIGVMKAARLARRSDPATYHVMCTIKKLFDPHNRLHRGCLIDTSQTT